MTDADHMTKLAEERRALRAEVARLSALVGQLREELAYYRLAAEQEQATLAKAPQSKNSQTQKAAGG